MSRGCLQVDTTFEKLPIQRLTAHDLRQPGSLLTLILIVVGVTFIAIFQAWAFRIEGRIPRYLAFYAAVGIVLLALMAIPRTNIRLHHYILALILLPGTSLQTRPSLLYQGLLVGLFINGIARWGFDSILQTPRELFGDDIKSPIPDIGLPSIDSVKNSITFTWDKIQKGYDSVSILINDVERFRGSEDHNASTFTWQRYKEAEPEYFGFEFVKYALFGKDDIFGEFNKPGTWLMNGTWIPPEPSMSS